MPPKQYIYIVMSANIVFESYTDPVLAEIHAKTILGAKVVSSELRTTLATSVVDDLVVAEYDESEDTNP